MKHFLHITGEKIDLSKSAEEILSSIQASLDRCYTKECGIVADSYKEINDRTCEIVIKRLLPASYSMALGEQMIFYIDESLITGISESKFVINPASTEKPFIDPIIPYYHGFYSFVDDFHVLFKHMNQTLVGERIARIKTKIMEDSITIFIKFSRLQRKYTDDILDLEVELGEPLNALRGEQITFSLNDMAEICEREHIKKKSYQGLIQHLKKDYDIDLHIT